MAHPVAHEGNPRTASITIDAGEVLSTATLEVEIPEPVGGTPLEETPTPRGSGSSCPGVFEWTRGDGNVAPIVLSTSCDDGEDDSVLLNDWNLTSMVVTPSTNCYGYSIATVPGGSSPDFLEVYISVKAHISGRPLTGICISASAIDEDPDHFTGYVLLLDPDNNLAQLLLFVDASLSNVVNGTVVYSASYTEAHNDILYMQIWRPFFNRIFASIFPSTSTNSVDAKWTTPSGLTLGLSVVSTVGFVAIGGQDGSMEYGSSGLTDCSTPARSTVHVHHDNVID